tara:strand:+ start:464 stop:982 length:519 start_codon:yes stop_codon:yes gene_type:complete
MKNSKLLVTTLFLSLCAFSASTQTIAKIAKNKWTYDSKVYKYSEMGSIFNQNSKAKAHYNIALQKKKASKAWAYTTGAIAGTGLILLAINKDCTGSFDCLDNSINEDLIPIVTLALVIPSGIISILLNGKADEHKQEAVDIFNNEMSIKMPPKEPLKLNIIASNGLRLQLKF